MLAIYCLENKSKTLTEKEKTMYKSVYRYNAFCVKSQKNENLFLYLLVITKKFWEYT